MPLPFGLPLYPLLKPFASRPGINHLFASAGERLLTPILARRNGVLTVAKDTTSLAGYERNARWFAQFRAIVVQGERDRELMRQVGVSERAIRMIRPGVPIAPYREATGPFTLLFASSPLTAEHFLSRGIYLMVRAAARMPEVQFLLVWRTKHLAKLQGLIAELGVRNINVLDGVVSDMGAVYDRVHATVLPAMEHQSFIPCPRSGLDSLAHGKPLLGFELRLSRRRTDPIGGRGGVQSGRRRARARRSGGSGTDYARYQSRTHAYMERYFSPAKHLALHRQLYESLADSVLPAASPVAATPGRATAVALASTADGLVAQPGGQANLERGGSVRGVTVIAITVAQLGIWRASARPSPPDPYDGAWTLTPAYSTTCSAGAVSVGITVGRVATHRIAPDSLAITSDVAVSGAGTTFLALYTLKTRLDSTTGEFRFAGPVDGLGPAPRRRGDGAWPGGRAGRLRRKRRDRRTGEDDARGRCTAPRGRLQRHLHAVQRDDSGHAGRVVSGPCSPPAESP